MCDERSAGVWGISMLIPAFVEGSELFPYRWWVVTFFAAAAAGFVVEFRAIWWMDRARVWQEGSPNQTPHDGAA